MGIDENNLNISGQWFFISYKQHKNLIQQNQNKDSVSHT